MSKNESVKGLELSPEVVERMGDDSGLVLVKKNPKQSK